MEHNGPAAPALRDHALQVQRHRNLAEEPSGGDSARRTLASGVNRDLQPRASPSCGEDRGFARDAVEVSLGEVEAGGEGGGWRGAGEILRSDERDGGVLVGGLVEADLGEAGKGGIVDASAGGTGGEGDPQREVADQDPDKGARVHGGDGEGAELVRRFDFSSAVVFFEMEKKKEEEEEGRQRRTETGWQTERDESGG